MCPEPRPRGASGGTLAVLGRTNTRLLRPMFCLMLASSHDGQSGGVRHPFPIGGTVEGLTAVIDGSVFSAISGQ